MGNIICDSFPMITKHTSLSQVVIKAPDLCPNLAENYWNLISKLWFMNRLSHQKTILIRIAGIIHIEHRWTFNCGFTLLNPIWNAAKLGKQNNKTGLSNMRFIHCLSSQLGLNVTNWLVFVQTGCRSTGSMLFIFFFFRLVGSSSCPLLRKSQS